MMAPWLPRSCLGLTLIAVALDFLAAGASALENQPQDLQSALARIAELEKQLNAKEASFEQVNGTIVHALEDAARPFVNFTSTLAPTAVIGKLKMKEILFEEAVLMIVGVLMVILCAVPVIFPCRRICETKAHRYYPFITVVNLLIMGLTLNRLYLLDVNQIFFWFVAGLEVLLEKAEKALIGLVALVGLFVVFKFKDRLLEAIGFENSAQLFGDFRDWATCWSMRRFHPVEVFVWKVEGLPSARLHAPNDVFVEAYLGYNVNMRTRVHMGAGHSCVFKESMQINFDPYDRKTKLTLLVKHQETVGSSEICQIQLGASQIQRLEARSGVQRTLGWGASSVRSEACIWKDAQFHSFDLLPAGRIWLRFQPVVSEDDVSSSCCCCWPSSLQEEMDGGYGPMSLLRV